MIKQFGGLSRMVWSSFVAALLVACGGSSGDVGKCYDPTPGFCYALGVDRSFPQPIQSAVGLYKGVTSNGRVMAGLIFDDNSFYAIYSGINQPSVTGGAVQGTIRADAGNFTVTDAIDVNLEGLGTQVASVTGKYAEKQFINGSITYPASKQIVSFSANYSTDFESTPRISDIAGTYSGTTNTSVGYKTVTLSISGTGDISGSGASGCPFNGTIKPRTSGNAYTVEIHFGEAPCGLPQSTLNGISYFDRTSNLLYTIASLSGQSTKFIAITAKQ